MPCFCLPGGGVALQSRLCQALSASPAVPCRVLGAVTEPISRLSASPALELYHWQSQSQVTHLLTLIASGTVNSLELGLRILFRALRWVRLTWTAGWVLKPLTDTYSQGSSLICTLKEIALMLVSNHSDWKKQKRVFVPLFLLGIVPPKQDYLHIVTWHMLVRGYNKHLQKICCSCFCSGYTPSV